MGRHAYYLIVVIVLVCARASAQQPADIWQYCSGNYTGVQECFNSLGEAETYMRQENPAGPTGRRFLESNGDPTFTGSVTNPTSIVYGYLVKPRPPVAYLEDYVRSITLGWGGVSPTGVLCGCPNPDGTGSAECDPYGSETSCADSPNSCYSCKTQGGDAGAIESAISAYFNKVPNACGVAVSQLYPWPSPADFAEPFSISTSNFQGLQYNNGDYGSGNADDPFNFELTVTHGQVSGGTCQTSTSYFVVTRNQHIQCDAGLNEQSGPLNGQGGTIPQSELISIDQICRSSETGQVIAGLVQSCQAGYGDPCFPGNGSQSETETDYSFGSLAFERTYSSLRLSFSNTRMGPGWYAPFGSRLGIPNGTSSTYVLLIDSRGSTDRFDQLSAGVYRSVNNPGSILTPVSGTTVTWNLISKGGLQSVYDSNGVLQSTVVIARPETKLTYTYGPQYDTQSNLLVPANAVASIIDAKGRQATFKYSAANVASNCSASAADPSCAEIELSSITLPDGTSVLQYAYDTSGNLASVTYPDGNSRKYSYNESANICPTSLPSACSGNTPPVGGFPHLLTGISEVSSGGLTTRYSTYQYDFRGRVVSSSLAGGANLLTLSYSSQTQTVLNFAYGNAALAGMQKTINFETVGGVFRKELNSTDLDPTTTVQFLKQASYDSTGRLQSVTDPLSVQSTYEYTNGLNLTAVTDGVATSALRRIETDWNDTYNVPTERRWKNSSGLETKTDWVYNTRGQVTARCEVDPADTSGYTCSSTTAPTTSAKVRRWVYTYCESVTTGCPIIGLLKSVDGPRLDVSDITTYSYYQSTDLSGCATQGGTCHYLGDLQTTTNALNQVTTYTSYDMNGRLARISDLNGTCTDMTYNLRGWLQSRTVRANSNCKKTSTDATTTFAYDLVGDVTAITDPDNVYQGFQYDAAHRLTDVYDPLNNHIHYGLDAAGNRTSETTYNPSGVVQRSLTRQFDQLNHLLKVLNSGAAIVEAFANPAEPPPTGTKYNNGYDGNGNAIYSVDGNGVGTESNYDALNRMLRTLQDHAGTGPTHDTTTQFAYDARSNLRSVTDPDNFVTNYTYDGLNNLTALASPDTGYASYTNDSGGNRKSQTDARLVTSTYSYDALNRLTGISYPTTTLNVSYSYDAVASGCYNVGRLTKIVDSSGNTTYCYDRHGNVLSKTQVTTASTGTTETTTYSYSLADRLTNIAYPSGASVTYGRDGAGRIFSVSYKASASSQSVSVLSNVSYYPFGPQNVLSFGNGRTLTRTYDQDYAIDKIVSSNSTGLVVDATVDTLGNLINASSSVGANPPTQEYLYDPLYRVTNIDNGSGTSLLAFTYEATGDRTSKTLQGQSAQAYTYSPGTHHLASVSGVARSYDQNGNPHQAGNVTLTYDNRNRLSDANLVVQTSRTVTTTTDTQYFYNGRGERVSKLQNVSTNTGTTGTPYWSVYDYNEAGQLLGEYPLTTSEPPNHPAEFVYLENLPIAYATGGTLYYIEADQLGTPRQLINPGATTSADTLVWKWDYFASNSAFGENTPNVQTITFNLRFPGQYYDSETGLNYNYARNFEPSTGRYLESDRIGLGGGVNTYAYVDLDPYVFSDPAGLSKECFWQERGDPYETPTGEKRPYLLRSYVKLLPGCFPDPKPGLPALKDPRFWTPWDFVRFEIHCWRITVNVYMEWLKFDIWQNGVAVCYFYDNCDHLKHVEETPTQKYLGSKWRPVGEVEDEEYDPDPIIYSY